MRFIKQFWNWLVDYFSIDSEEDLWGSDYYDPDYEEAYRKTFQLDDDKRD